MGISLGSLIQTAGGAFEKKRQRQLEDEERAQEREMNVMRRALMQAQIGGLQAKTATTGNVQETARAYIQQYPELASLASNPAEVIQRGRARDQEGLIRGRPVADYPVISETGEVLLVPRPRPESGISPLQPGTQPPPTPAPRQDLGQGVTVPAEPPPAAPPPQQGQQPGQPPRTPTPTGQPGVRGTGVRTFRPQLFTPTQSETDAANWAPGVMQGFTVVRDAWRQNPTAVQEAVPFLQALNFSADIPGIGKAISQAVRAGGQQGLSPEAQRVAQGFLRWTASRVFASGGKQLTQTEITAAVGQYLPAINEDPTTSEQRIASMAQDAFNVLLATGRAYPRYKGTLTAAGAPDLGDFDPYTQQFTGGLTYQDLLNPNRRTTQYRPDNPFVP